ncbi:MAG: FtsX-like permease family protein [Agathobacter sp.]|nr:FtsX-like permease family protein [Agathobacter sp.]
MWYEILKKDLMKRKGVNMILFFFITLSTVFLASSISNINLVTNGVENYMECANVSDVMVVLGTENEKGKFEDWLESRSEVTEYAYEQMCEIKADDVSVIKAGKKEEIKAEGDSFYLGYAGGKFAKPLDNDGNELTVKEGEVALPISFFEKNGLKAGDKLCVKIDSNTYTYKIAEQCKDIMFGNDLSGMSRFIFSKADYDRMAKENANVKIGVYSFNTENEDETVKSMNSQELATLMTTITRGTYSMLYVFDMIMAALLIVIGLCLIFISLMILRFSLVFTMEENYREIGVMKAIGMRNFSIQKIYFIKYLALVLAGALVGFGLSIPVGNVMMESVSKNMVLGDSTNTLGLNLVCSVAVVIFVAAMCILFTGKLKKISAIEAIRNGDNGERYHKRRGLNLHTKKRMGTIAFLGLNDILCNKKRYLVLFFTFCISFVLITVPLNTLTTMESREMVSKFSLDPDAAVYMETIEKKGDDVYHNTTDLEHALRRVERELAEKGYDASLSVGALFFVEWETGEDDTIIKYLTSYPIGVNGSYCEYTEGEAPKLENEVAFSKKVMEENELHIGDTVKTKINGEEKKFIITGYYSDYMQLGESARLNPAIDMSGEIMSGYWKPMVDMDTDLSQEEMVRKLEKEFPEYDWVTAQQVVDTNVGSVKDTMRAMQIPMTAMLCILIMLITILMMKLFIVREKGQLAMLKSIGYRNRHIRLWLMMRMVWVVMISMIFAIPLSMMSNRFVLTSIFAIMGAELRIQVEPVKTYLVYPGILLTGIVVATIVATMNVKKINTSDMKIAE